MFSNDNQFGQFKFTDLLPSLIQGTATVVSTYFKSTAEEKAIKEKSKAQIASIVAQYKGIREQREAEMEQRAIEAQAQQAGFPIGQMFGGSTLPLILIAGLGIVLIMRR